MIKGSKKGFSTSKFREAIQISAGTKDLVPVKIFDAIVITGSQNQTTMTCFVDSCDSTTNNLEVRYNLCISDGIVKVPADGSVVTVAMTAFTDPYIVKDTDLNSYFLGIGNQSFSNNGSIQSFQSYVESGDGSYGGFVKIIDPNDENAGLLKKVNQLEQTVNALILALQTTSIVLAPSGTYPLTTNPNVASLTNISPLTTETDLENPNIVHGLTLLPS